jgi:anti-sigma B factor antagonist
VGRDRRQVASNGRDHHQGRLVVLFALDVYERDGWQVVAVTGEVELATAPRLRQQVVSLVGAEAVHVVLDLSRVDFIDSVGLGVVVGALKRTRAGGGDLRVVAPQARVRSLFAVTRLDEIIEVLDCVDDAVAGPAATSAVGGGEASADG